jgi:hypothetical protein
MSVLDEGYKCSVCGDTFSSSTSAKKHVSRSKACRAAAKVIPFRIVTGQSDRRVGGREILHIRSERISNISNDHPAGGRIDNELAMDRFSDASARQHDSGLYDSLDRNTTVLHGFHTYIQLYA